MRPLIYIHILFLFLGCIASTDQPKDCLTESDHIERSTKPDKIEPLPIDFIHAIEVLDNILSEKEKLVIKCATEEELETRKPLQDLWMWVYNKFGFSDKNSHLRQLLQNEGVHELNGDQILAVLYHRHLNGQNLHIENILTIYRIRNKTNGRITSLKIYKDLTEDELKKIINLSEKFDSLITVSVQPDLSVITETGKLPENRKDYLINQNEIIHYTREIRKDINKQRSYDYNLKKLKELISNPELNSFDELSTGSKLILLEEIRMQTIE